MSAMVITHLFVSLRSIACCGMIVMLKSWQKIAIC
nr:MAG TPA: hypothetical protein [Caudoviricetes sp.]